MIALKADDQRGPAKPPRTVFQHFVARVNRKIIYIPLGQLSPTKLKKIRVCMCWTGISGGKRRRSICGDYK